MRSGFTANFFNRSGSPLCLTVWKRNVDKITSNSQIHATLFRQSTHRKLYCRNTNPAHQSKIPFHAINKRETYQMSSFARFNKRETFQMSPFVSFNKRATHQMRSFASFNKRETFQMSPFVSFNKRK